MRFDQIQFRNFLEGLAATRQQVDDIFKNATDAYELSDASMILLWQSIFDTMMTTQDPAERLKWGTLIEKVFSALTDRRALQLRQAKASGEAPKPPLDADTLQDLQSRLKLL